MKKHNSILIAVTILALAAMSCNIQFGTPTPTFTPTPAPAGPLPGPDNAGPGDPIHQGPDVAGSEHPIPQRPGPNPNEEQILSFGADRTTLNKGECAMLHWETQGGFGVILNEQPVERSGGQQVCPPQTTVYGLGLDIGNQMLRREVTITVNGSGQNPNPIPTTVKPNKPGGGNKPITPTVPGGIQIVPVTLVVANLNLAIVNIFVRPGDGHVMATFRNAGNTNLNTTTTLKCANGAGNGGLVSTKTVTLNLKPGEIFNQDTGWTKQTAATLTCSFTPHRVILTTTMTQ